MKKLLTLFIALTLVMTMTTVSASAAGKPGKVKVTKKAVDTTITLKWKKAKNANKYQVYQLKGKKFKKIKTTKKRKVVIKNLKLNKTYKFKVRGINKKLKGKFTTVKVKTRKPKTHTKPVDPAKTTLVEGDTYVINNLDTPQKIKITDYSDRGSDGLTIEGTTSNGGTYAYSSGSDDSEWLEFTDGSYTKHMDISDCGEAHVTGLKYIVKIKDNDTKGCWSLDGTDPKLGQSDYTGYSKWCVIDVDYAHRNEYYGGELKPYDLKNNPYEKDTTQVKTKLRGTLSKGTSDIWKEPHVDSKRNIHIKVFNKNKLIYELKTKANYPVY